MPTYEFKCHNCRQRKEIIDILPPLQVRCPCAHLMSRVYSFSFKTPMQPHFNPTTGSYVSNESKFSDELKRHSETATMRTGIVHDFQPTDPTDMKANGVTSEGLKETFDATPDPKAREILRKYIDSE